MMPGGGMSVLLAHRLRRHKPVAERSREFRDRATYCLGIGSLQHIGCVFRSAIEGERSPDRKRAKSGL
jgi:hypothetical protein